ncbi:MAG: Nif11-like leader peptide family natural product precursor [Clostridia bacterium]|nr:Nif11-like leader peptide family natural product precursor [Clostridia bacterium]
MSINNAKALIQKLRSDKSLAKAFANAKTTEEFLNLAAKHGYDITLDEFTEALDELKDVICESIDDLKDALEESNDDGKQIDQAVGLTIVGVDYAFVAVQTSST